MHTKAPFAVPLSAEDIERRFYSVDELEAMSRAYSRRIGDKAASLERLDYLLATSTTIPVSAELKANAIAEEIGNKIGTCPTHWLHGSDKAGHRFAKELYCGKEWCPVCGKKDSNSHKRRFASWLPKAQQLNALGLMVIEWPLASRDKLRSKKALSYYGKLAVKVLTGNFEIDGRRKRGEMLRRGEVAEIKAKYFERGMRRLHYFGDVEKELSRLGCIDVFTDGDKSSVLEPSVKSNIHLNMLLDSGYIPRPWLMHLIKTLRIAFNEPKLIVHYGYVTEPGAMVHLLKYTTRATFKKYEWDKKLAGELFGFRNMRSWGVWSGPALWQLEDLPGDAKAEIDGVNVEAVNSLSKGYCYRDGLPIIWSKPRPIAELRADTEKVSLGAGYYELSPVLPPADHLIESDNMRWHRCSVDVLRHLATDAALEMVRDKLIDTLPDATMPALFPELVSDRYYKGADSALASNSDALWGGMDDKLLA